MKSIKQKAQKLSHFKTSTKLITACLGTFSDFDGDTEGVRDFLLSPSSDDESEIECVDYHSGLTSGMTAGPNTYVISEISERDKLSRYLDDCTSVVATGVHRITGKRISFLSHQDPIKFLSADEYGEKFIIDFSSRLLKLKKLCRNETIDIVLAGGNFILDESVPSSFITEAKATRATYKSSIRLLSEIIQAIIGFEPLVIVGPKMVARSDAMLYRNNNCRLYLVRPEVGNATAESYYPSNISLQESKWK